MLDSRFQGGSTGSNPVGDTRKNASDQVRHLVSCVQCKPHALSEPAGSETAAAALDVAGETEHELGPRRWLEVRVVEPVVTQQPGPRISTRRTVSAQNARLIPAGGSIDLERGWFGADQHRSPQLRCPPLSQRLPATGSLFGVSADFEE